MIVQNGSVRKTGILAPEDDDIMPQQGDPLTAE